METRKVGSLDVSIVGLGTNNFGGRIDKAQTALVLDAAIDNGINFIDTADVYGGTMSETFIGEMLGERRLDVVVATKFGMSINGQPANGSATYMRRCIEDSLQRLQSDYVDLYIYHRPDPDTPIAETLGAMGQLVAEGKVREIGCSNFSVAQLQEAEAATAEGAPKFVNVQNNYSLLHREPENGILAECLRQSIGFVPYSPLASGLLTGKFRKGVAVPEGTRIAKMADERRDQVLSDENLAIVERLSAFATERRHTLLELAFSWLLAQSAVSSVIAGATSPEQVMANVDAASWKMSNEELGAIDHIITQI